VRDVTQGIVTATCGGMTVRAIATASPTPGDTVNLATRPERMRFAETATANDQQNRIWATVTETVFAGERCRYLCQSDCGASIVVKEPSGAAVRRRRIGERLEIAWSIADTVVV